MAALHDELTRLLILLGALDEWEGGWLRRN